jgi:hypothetical protein
MLNAVKRVSGLPFQLGGEEHSGWLPAGAAVPLPTPIHNVLLDVEIQFDGHGYLLCYSARDGSTSGDTWHQSLADAEQTAEEQFGIKPSQWQLA